MAIANRLRQYMKEQGVKFEVIRHPRSGSSMQSAETAHIPGDRMAKAVLLEDEQGYLQYLALIIHESFSKVNGQIDPISEDELGEAEEANTEILEAQSAQSFRERMTPFFENYPQEDLLALVEDALMEEEEMLTKEGREPMFIAMKTLIDCLIA